MSSQPDPASELVIDRRRSLRGLNTFGLPAVAGALVRIGSDADVRRVLAHPEFGGKPKLILGAGSNIVLTRDPHAVVLKVEVRGRRLVAETPEAWIVEFGGGESWHDAVDWTLAQGWPGLENLALIPGTVGAAPVQNIGAYGIELAERFDSLDAVDLVTGRGVSLDAKACAFGYRDSVFKHAGGAGWLVTDVRFRLSREPAPRTGYADLRDELARRSIARATPADVADAVSTVRRRKLPDPARLGNAGSFFRNPVLPADRAAELARRHPGLPAWPADGGVKLAAAWLIDQCGWKGRREGDAGVHAAHALVLVNHGRASGAQILALARRVRDSVLERFGVELEPEPLIVGAAWL